LGETNNLTGFVLALDLGAGKWTGAIDSAGAIDFGWSGSTAVRAKRDAKTAKGG